eukprot:6607890-Pyramimonas_sp.AAC.1
MRAGPELTWRSSPRCSNLMLSGSLLGGGHNACGHVDPGMYVASEFTETYVTGSVPVGTGSTCVVSVSPHVFNSASDSDP